MAPLRHGFEEPGDAEDIRLVVDTIPTLAWSAGADGSAEFFNQRWLDYTGLSAEQALGSGWQVAIHPDDLPRILETFREALNSVKPYEVEGRFRRFDGSCATPTNETSTAVLTGVPAPEVAFSMTMQGGSFTGSSVKEVSQIPGSNGCYWSGSTLPQHPAVQGSSWSIGFVKWHARC
jgi:PAS domain S-box-containing protein